MSKRRSDSSRELKLVCIGMEGAGDAGEDEGEAAQPTRAARRLVRGLRAWRSYWHEFCSNTSLHGLRYLSEPRRPLAERLWWVVALIVSFVVCSHFIVQLYRKWETSPVIVTFSESPTPIWQIPFPAVTLCSEIKVKRSVFNYTKAMFAIRSENCTEEQKENFEYASLLCNLTPFDEGNDTLDHEEVIRHIEKFSPSVDDILSECKLKGHYYSCSRIFSPILTDEGLCFTFNSFQANELLKESVSKTHMSRNITSQYRRRNTSWTLEGGYNKDAGRKAYPHRAQSSGAAAGLSLTYFAEEEDMDAWCRWPALGLKMLLHSPLDHPQVGNEFFRVPLNRDVVVGVRPSMLTTSKALWNYPPKIRQCYLTSERQLRFFKIYTQKNCQMECLSNYTMKECNCSAYYMPHEETDPMCGAGKNFCVENIGDKLMNNETELKKCACTAACVDLKYDVEISQTHFAWYKLLETNQTSYNLSELTTKKLGHISIYFKDMQFITSQRRELYGLTDFLANCGGLLGLFMGFSFLSLVEFIYFFTVRLYSNVLKRHRDKKHLRNI